MTSTTTSADPSVERGQAPVATSGWTRWVGFTTALIVLILLGRALLMPGTNLALYWPAAGIVVLGVAAARDARELRVVIGTTMVVATLGNVVTGVPLVPALFLGLANVITGIAPALWLAHAPGRLGTLHGGPGRPLGERLRIVQAADLARVWLALVVGGVASFTAGATAIILMGGAITPVNSTDWVVRLSVGAFVVAAPLLTLACATRHRELSRQPSDATAWLTWTRAHAVETALIAVGGFGLVTLVFYPSHDLPVTYAPLVIAVWAGLRLPPAVAGTVCFGQGLVTGLLVLFAGGGPFAGLGLSPTNTMSVQGFAMLIVATALLLSLVIAERDGLSERLHDAQVQATQRADDLTVITDTVPVGIMVMAQGGGLELMNPTAAAMASAVVDERGAPRGGWRRADGSVLEPDQFPLARAWRGETVRQEVIREPQGMRGRPLAWSIDAVPLPACEDGRARVLLAFRNVTDEQEHVASLESFAGVVAHDLQNPVTAIKGWSDVAIDELDLAEIDADSGIRRAVARIRSSSDRAGELIRDLLSYSVGRTTAVERRRIDLDALAAAARTSVEEAYAHRRPQITIGALGSYNGDPVLLEQMLTNLIGNATKYTCPEVRPVVEVEASRSAGELHLEISDNGVGIPPAARLRVFEAFERAHDGDERFTGTGLGLAICAQAVRRHGGRIRVEDGRDGHGSRFLIDLPLVTADDASEQVAPLPQQAAGSAGSAVVAPPGRRGTTAASPASASASALRHAHSLH